MLSRKATEISAQVQKDETQGEHFTGTVATDKLIKSQTLPEVQGTKVLKVYFQPKARTHQIPYETPSFSYAESWQSHLLNLLAYCKIYLYMIEYMYYAKNHKASTEYLLP